MDDAQSTLRFALEKYADRVEALPVDQLVMDSARRNDKRPAYVKMAVPDEMVKSLRGDRGSADMILLVRIPRDVIDRESSAIVLPGEVT